MLVLSIFSVLSFSFPFLRATHTHTCSLSNVICTSRDGDRFWRLPEVVIRGNNIKYLRIPEEVINLVPEEDPMAMKGGGGRGFGGRGGEGRGRGGGKGKGDGGKGKGDGKGKGKWGK